MSKSASFVLPPLQYSKLNPSRSDFERFWSRVLKKGPDDCWMWKGEISKEGYGKFWFQGRSYFAHRWSHQVFVGDVEQGLFVCHSCDVPACVNPGHLWKGTHEDNMEDMVRKLRQACGDRNGSRLYPEKLLRGDLHPARLRPWSRPRGSKHWTRANPEKLVRGEASCRSKLTEQAVLEIRATAHGKRKYGVVALSEKYGVSKGSIMNVVTRKTWTHLP